MKPIRIDFSANAGPWAWSLQRASVRILLVCVLCCGLVSLVVLLRARQLELEYAQAQDVLAQMASLQQKQAQQMNAVARQTPEEEAVLKQAQTLRTLPWESIFQAVESTSAPVRVQSFEPDLARGVVKLQAHADDLAAMRTFLQELERLNVFRRVVLQRQDEPSTPGAEGIDFACEALLETAYRLPEVTEAQP